MTVKTAKKYTAMKMFLKVFIVINVLPILIFFWLMLLGLDGQTHSQCGGAWATLILGVIAMFVHLQISLEKK